MIALSLIVIGIIGTFGTLGLMWLVVTLAQ